MDVTIWTLRGLGRVREKGTRVESVFGIKIATAETDYGDKNVL